MELTLVHQTNMQISVTCNGQPSHIFDLHPLLLREEQTQKELLEQPAAYGQKLYEALFSPDTTAHRALTAEPERILLVTTDNDLDAIPWEYAYGPDGFLILEYQFVRGLPVEQRIDPPLLDSGLHIVAVPSNPLDKNVPSLNIESEWVRLKEIIQHVPYAITLERTRPPTIEQIRALVANQRHRVIHFMGHGGQDERGALLYFELDNGDLNPVTARQLMLRVRGTVFLVTLNACASATPGPTAFSNLAAALMRQKTPYALGMRFSIPDEDAHAFSRTFYSELAQGVPVEEALRQARFTLADSPHLWVVGVPVLYTALAQPAKGCACIGGSSIIKEHQPHIEASTLPRAEGIFQGRSDELKQIGTLLTVDSRPSLVTIHGGGGQGKTALAREAVERFAYAWPGGVWATSLENLPSRATFVIDLARFLGIPTQEIADPAEVERRMLGLLIQCRILLVLDNAETLIDAVERKDASALLLVEFIKQLPGPFVSLLITSRVQLEWSGEVSFELGGLSPLEGADLFRQSAPQRTEDITPTLAQELSRKLKGHPLGLHLLGQAFNAIAISLPSFLQECDAQLGHAENKYLGPEHRHRTINACIELSIRYLADDLRALLSGLWVFRAPFLAETAAAIYEDAEEDPSPIHNHLHTLWLRGLLVCETATVRDGTIHLYHLLPTMRPYVEHHMQQVYEREKLLTRFGIVYSHLASVLHRELDRSAATVKITQLTREDLELGVEHVTGVTQGYYLLHCGWILHRLGFSRRGLGLLERAMEIAQGQNQTLKLLALTNIARVYQATGKPQEALQFFAQAFPIMRERDDRVREAATLTNMALVYRDTGKPQKALALYEQALPIMREAGDRAGEAVTLTNMAAVYQVTGKPQEALALYEQALPITREVGNRVGEAVTLNNIAAVYQVTGKPQEALTLYEQALPIRHEIGDWAGEATTLNNIAGVYRATGKPQEALALYEQALPIMREVGNQAGEANTLSSMALVYQHIGKPQEALALYEQALPIWREVGNRVGEGATLDSMAGVYDAVGKPQEALALYEQALAIMREVDDRAGEANTLNNMAGVYLDTGKPQEALRLHEQALPIRREVGDRAGEAATLNNMAGVYDAVGKLQEALALYERALPIMQEVGDRAGGAATLNNIALVYRHTGKPQEALALYEQALPMTREVGDPAREATTLNNMAGVYRDIGKLQEALALYEQALPIRREVGDRAGEAATLNNMAGVYRDTGKLEKALAFYEKALPIMLEVGNRAGEAATLNNMAGLYREIGKPQEALWFYEQALPIMREINNRAGEAVILNNVALVYQSISKPREALALYEQALPIMREIGNRAGEAATLLGVAYLLQSLHRYAEALTAFEQSTTYARQIVYPASEVASLVGMALLLYRHLNRTEEAIICMERAIAVLVNKGIPQNAAGQTPEDLRRLLQAMRSGASLGEPLGGLATMPAAQVQQVVANTITVMRTAQEYYIEWRNAVVQMLQDAQQRGDDWQVESDFFTAVLDILDGRMPTLSSDHPYAYAVAAIQSGIASR